MEHHMDMDPDIARVAGNQNAWAHARAVVASALADPEWAVGCDSATTILACSVGHDIARPLPDPDDPVAVAAELHLRAQRAVAVVIALASIITGTVKAGHCQLDRLADELASPYLLPVMDIDE
jgi:hypothetical protein